MQRYQDSIILSTGQAVVGASVQVLTYPAGAVATIYSDNGSTVTTNPLITDGNGHFAFYAADARYSLVITKVGIAPITVSDILLEDPADGSAALSASGGAALVGFLPSGITPTYGWATRTAAAKLSDTLSVKDFKNSNGIAVACDGVTDDTTGLQAAIDWFGATTNIRGGYLIIPGPIALSDTILISNKSITLIGYGLSTANAAVSGTYVNCLAGLAGKPVFKIRGCLHFRMQGFRFRALSASKPTAALNFNRNSATDSQINTQAHCSNIYIGNIGGSDTDTGVEFTNGILFDGDNTNDEFNLFENVYINQCTTGVNISNAQNANNYFENLRVTNCTTGLIGANGTNGTNWCFSTNTVDLQCLTGSTITIREFRSELAGRLFSTTTAVGDERLIIESGSWQITNNINADGQVIAAATNAQTFVSLSNFRFTTIGGYVGPTPTLTLKDNGSASVSKYLQLINVDGIGSANIDVTTATGGPQYRFVEMVNQGTPGALTNLVFRNILGAGESINTARFDTASIRLTGGMTLTTNNTNDLAATGNRFRTGYFGTSVSAPTLVGVSGSPVGFDLGDGGGSRWQMTTSAHLIPVSNNAFDLGATGNLVRNAYIGGVIFGTAPATETGATRTIGVTDNTVIANRAGTITMTLPAVGTSIGRKLRFVTIQAQTVISASSNVVPLAGGAAGTAILAATAGKWADLECDGANWIITASN